MPNYVRNEIVVEGTVADLKNFCQKFTEQNGTIIIDFKKIIPMPETMNIASGSYTLHTLLVYLKSNLDRKGVDFLKSVPQCVFDYLKIYKDTTNVSVFPVIAEEIQNKFSNYLGKTFKEKKYEDGTEDERAFYRNDFLQPYPETQKGYYIFGKLVFDNLTNYGYPTWYEWCIANWGTKWNACESQIDFIDDESLLVTFDTAWDFPKNVIVEMAKMFPTLKFEGKYADEGIIKNSGRWDIWRHSDDVCEVCCNSENLSDEEHEIIYDEIWGF